MPISLPPVEKSLGRKVVVFCDTPPAAPTGIPTLTEVNAGLQASLHLYTPFNVTPDQSTGQGPRKLGAKTVPTENGLVTYPAVDVQGSYLPQKLGTPGAVGNEVYEMFKAAEAAGDKITAVVFDAIDGDISPIPTGAVGDVYLTEPGVIRKGQTGDGEFDHVAFNCSLVISGGEAVAVDHVFTT
ncbi:hypothetical protein [Nocardioides nitrophenolicus]|uniref:hypothetical protein n=1 Tax=Nocardioides nitrophenolicus TaxID=60489 RepID=UPI0019584192|nr:hypothetical protein [Nocardioides nitrophenolicus]MBM7518272.1 hypothetical protein [Nocardioides nitrophenolicus]